MLRRHLLPVALLAAAALTLSACGDDGDELATADRTTTTDAAPADDAPPPTTAPPATTATSTPAGLVLQVTTGGGFTTPELHFATVPAVSVYDDRSVVVAGPQTMEYPGPALPNLLRASLTESRVRESVQAAKDAGVTSDPDLGEPPVADAPTTTFVLVDGGRTHRLDVYALDMDDPGPNMTARQRENRGKLRALRDRLTALGDAARDPYRAEAVSVLVAPYAEPEPGGPDPQPGSADWPLGDLATGGTERPPGGRCLGFAGADAAKVLDAAAPARANTRWRSGGKAWALTFRPALPGETTCG